MATAITILNHELAPLVTRAYKHDDEHDASLIEIFENFRLVLANNNINNLQPVIPIRDYNYVYIYSNNLILLIVVANRFYQLANIMCYLVFLKNFESILKSYFKTPVLDQDMIIDNYLLLYELFDEVMDFGFVQITDYNILNEYIKMKLNISSAEDGTNGTNNYNNNNNSNSGGSSHYNSKSEKDKIKEMELEHELNSSISRISTTQLSWRPKGIFYKKNEVFIDIIEKINLLVDSQNRIKKQVIFGEVKVKCFLSGMPTLRLGLNEFLVQDEDETSTIDSFKKVKFDNLNFHQCVELSQFSNDNTISFIPPDGKFSLLNYKLQVHKPALIRVTNISFRKKIIYKRKPSRRSHSILDNNKQPTLLNKRASTAPQNIPSLANDSKPSFSSLSSSSSFAVPPSTSSTTSHQIDTASIDSADSSSNIVKESKLLISVDLITKFTKRLSASDVSVIIPINFKKFNVNFDQMPRFKTKIGVVVLDLEKQCIIWRISSIGGGREFQMSSEISLNNDKEEHMHNREGKNDNDDNSTSMINTDANTHKSEKKTSIRKQPRSEILDDSDSSLENDSSDSEAEKTYDYYYNDHHLMTPEERKAKEKAEKLKKIYKTIKKEQKELRNSKYRRSVLTKSEGPTSPSLLMESDNHQANRDNLSNLANLLGSPPTSISEQQQQHEREAEMIDLHINKNLVKVNFKIENLTHSGLKVTYLKINEPQLKYTSFPWVKYMSTSDEEYGFKLDYNYRKGKVETIVKHVKERKDAADQHSTKFIGGGNIQKRVWKKL